MATGTQIYNKDNLKIYPITDAEAVISNALGNPSTVEANLMTLFSRVSALDGSLEAVNSILIQVRYLPTDTDKVDEVKISNREWSDLFILPSEQYPYIWKRTKYSFSGATEDQAVVIYEIVASDISTIILTIYTRVDQDTTPMIEYKLKQDSSGKLLYLDSEGKETTNPTDNKAYDYNYYWNGTLASKIDSMPPAPEGADYSWHDYPQDISPSYPRVFMSRRIKQGGKWKAFSTPAQYGQWPANT